MYRFIFIVVFLFSAIFSFSAEFKEKYEEGLAFYKQKNYTEAIKCFDQSIAEYPLDFNSYLKKSYAHYRIKEYNKAIETIERGFEFEQKDSRYFFMKAQFYDKLEKNTRAMYNINMAIKFKPDNISYYKFRGTLHMLMGNYSKAVSDFNIVQVYNSDDFRVYYNKGLALNNLKRSKDACLEWAYAQEYNKNCKKMLHYRCSKIDLRPYTRKQPTGSITIVPKFNVNDETFSDFVKRSIKYPELAIINSEEGCVVVQLDLLETDYSKNCKILNSVSILLDSSALAIVMQSSEYWERTNLTEANSKIVIPIRYRISEPIYKERRLLDSISIVKDKDTEAELAFIKEYLKYNPFHYGLRKRHNHLIVNLKNDENQALIDFSSIHGLFVDEVSPMYLHYRIFLNELFEFCEKEEASFFILSDSYIDPDVWTAYKMYTMNGTLYTEGNLYKNTQEGKFKEYYANGTVCIDMNFQTGQPVNYLTYYYPSGKMKHKIYLKQDQFQFINYLGELGNSLLSGEKITWEYTNQRAGNLDTNVVTCIIDVKEKLATWQLYKGANLACKEVYKKGKIISCDIYDGGKADANGSYISSEYLMPMSAIFYRGTLKRSQQLSEKTLLLYESLDPNLKDGIVIYTN